ncbi:MAG TPA: SAM-dependent methyltransferase [Dehalococcoidia bacterium]|jgi:SAM-dependent MidA family methyltransferase
MRFQPTPEQSGDTAQREAPPAEPAIAFGFATENAVLRRRVTEQLRAAGVLTFRQFMQMALYDPDEGYYRRREPIGAHGDYLTSPELHPLFGALIRSQLEEMWELVGRPATFAVVEMGAGSGALARAIVGTPAADAFDDALRYAIVEPDRRLREVQGRTLGSLAGCVDWYDALEMVPPLASGCLLSNELIDSFPVHRVVVRNGRLRELLVGLDGERFVAVESEPSTPMLAAYFERLGLLPGEGCAAEVNLDALAWMRSLASVIARGFVLTLDYGYPAAQLYAAWRVQGTLLCYYRHTVHSDPFIRVGYQDLTAHVDFTSLCREGETAGLKPLGFTSQQRFLASLGIEGALRGGPAGGDGLEEYLARRRAVADLLNPEGLGRIRVFAQGKAVGEPALRGFAAGNEVEALCSR